MIHYLEVIIVNQEISGVRESLNLILNKLNAINSKLEQQKEYTKRYIERSSTNLEPMSY